MTESLVTLGEVQTALLHHSTSVAPQHAERLLEFVSSERVRRSDRPVAYAISPETLTGVDCLLPTASGAKVRAVGTAISRATITGGHLLQGSTYVTVVRGEAQRRLPWSHYLASRGVVETIGKANAGHLADGFLGDVPARAHLNLGAISTRVVDDVQASADLDHRPAFRSTRTRLRWVLLPVSGAESVVFSIGRDDIRRVRLPRRNVDLSAQVEFCEDLALHDWLLTTLLEQVERSRIGAGARSEVIGRLRPAVDYLMHLWMPAARLHRGLADLWMGLEDRPGLSRQWRVNVDRVRDQLALEAIERLSPK